MAGTLPPCRNEWEPAFVNSDEAGLGSLLSGRIDLSSIPAIAQRPLYPSEAGTPRQRCRNGQRRAISVAVPASVIAPISNTLACAVEHHCRTKKAGLVPAPLWVPTVILESGAYEPLNRAGESWRGGCGVLLKQSRAVHSSIWHVCCVK